MKTHHFNYLGISGRVPDFQNQLFSCFETPGYLTQSIFAMSRTNGGVVGANPRAIKRATCKMNSGQQRPTARGSGASNTKANYVGRPPQAGSSELLKSTNEEEPCQRQPHLWNLSPTTKAPQPEGPQRTERAHCMYKQRTR